MEESNSTNPKRERPSKDISSLVKRFETVACDYQYAEPEEKISKCKAETIAEAMVHKSFDWVDLDIISYLDGKKIGCRTVKAMRLQELKCTLCKKIILFCNRWKHRRHCAGRLFAIPPLERHAYYIQ